MTGIVNAIVNSTIGLVCTKLRDYTAQKLNESDINDDKLRSVVIREIDDIKSKLDHISRKDLCSSVSFFKEGVNRLYNSLSISDEVCGSSTSRRMEEERGVEGAIASRVSQFPVTQTDCVSIQRASELFKSLGNVEITSLVRYKSAKESFKEAKRLATEAFNNAALKTEERILACKLRITSRILEEFQDDPKAVFSDCLLYLEELQDLSVTRKMFSVWRNSRKGITHRLRAYRNKKERTRLVESVQQINVLLMHLKIEFLNETIDHLSWPMIKINKATHHSFLQDETVLRGLKEKNVRIPWVYEFPEFNDDYDEYIDCALTSKGEIISRVEGPSKVGGLDLTRRSGVRELFCDISSKSKICCFTVDEYDNVYIVIEVPSSPEEDSAPCSRYKLLTFDANGSISERENAKRNLEIIEEPLERSQLKVTKDGLLIIYCDKKKTIYVCDSKNTKPDYKFLLPVRNEQLDELYHISFTVSNENEIIYTLFNDYKYKFLMYIISTNGEVRNEVRIPVNPPFRKFRFVMNVAFDHINGTILVSFYRDDYDYISDDDDNDNVADNDCSDRVRDSAGGRDRGSEGGGDGAENRDGDGGGDGGRGGEGGGDGGCGGEGGGDDAGDRDGDVGGDGGRGGEGGGDDAGNRAGDAGGDGGRGGEGGGDGAGDRDDRGDADNDDDDDVNDLTTVFWFSNTGELLRKFKVQFWYDRLASHPKGYIALVRRNRAVMVQMGRDGAA